MATPAVTLVYAATATVTETVGGTPGAEDNNALVTHNQYNSTGTYTSATGVPVTKAAVFNQALSGGAATIDLEALVGTNSGTVVGTGLKVQLFKIKNEDGNSAVTVSEGAANGYALMGASWSVILLAGQEFTFFGNEATPDIAGADSEIDLAGTDTDAVEIVIVMG